MSEMNVKDPLLRAAAVSHLLGLQETGELRGGEVAICADSFRCSERTVYRWMEQARAAGGQYAPVERKRHELTQEMRDAYALFCGRAAAAYEDLKERGLLGSKPMSYTTFWRMIVREMSPGYRAGLRGGEAARRGYDLHLKRPRGYRNEAWEADHKEADVWVDVAGKPRKPWITLFVNCSNVGIVGLAVTPHAASSDAVLLAFRDAVQMGGGHGPFGGLPGLVRVDGGRDFRCDALKEAFGKFGIAHVVLPPRHPELKGTVEAVNGAVKEMLFIGLPGCTERPTNGASLKKKPKSVDGLLTFEQFVQKLRTWVHKWNCKHRIRNLGNRTPQEVWDADLTPIREVDPAALHAYSLKAARGEYVISGNGIAWNNAHYITDEPWMSLWFGSKVTVRYQPHHQQQIEVYDPRTNRYLGSATRQDEISEQQRQQVRKGNEREAARLRAALNTAQKQLTERLVLRLVFDPGSGSAPVESGFAGESAGHEIDHREVDHGFGAVWVGFVVAGQAAVVHEPADAALDGPPPGDDLESFDAWRALDGMDIDAQAGAVVDGGRAVSGVDPRLGHPGVGGGDPGEQVDAGRGVGHAGGGDQDGQEQAQCVAAQVPLAADDAFSGVGALAGEGHVGGGLDGLGVQYAGGGFGVVALGLTEQAPQQAGELFEDAVLLPLGEVAVHRRPWGEVVREVAPGDTGAVHVEDRVHEVPQVVFGWAADVQGVASASGPPGGEDGRDQFPAFVREVAGVPVVRGHVSDVPRRRQSGQGVYAVEAGRVGRRREVLE
jgi:putative transposase